MNFSYDFSTAFFIIGGVVLPIAYLILCIWMKRAVRNPPIMPFFFIFGSIGGYVLLLCLSAINSLFAFFLVTGSFLIAVFIAVLVGLIKSLRAKPLGPDFIRHRLS